MPCHLGAQIPDFLRFLIMNFLLNCKYLYFQVLSQVNLNAMNLQFILLPVYPHVFWSWLTLKCLGNVAYLQLSSVAFKSSFFWVAVTDLPNLLSSFHKTITLNFLNYRPDHALPCLATPKVSSSMAVVSIGDESLKWSALGTWQESHWVRNLEAQAWRLLWLNCDLFPINSYL